MSNPLDPIVETLRAAEPRPEAVERTLAALHRPHPPRLLPLAVGVAVLSGVMLWPREGSGLAWAQVAAQDLPPRYHERMVYTRGGESITALELWSDRPADAYRNRVRFLDPNLSARVRKNAFYEVVMSPKGYYTHGPDYGAFSRRPKAKSLFDPREIPRRGDLSEILGDKTVHEIGIDRNVATRVGLADRYRLDYPVKAYDAKVGKPTVGRRSYEVFVEPGTTRVLGYDHIDKGGRMETTIEYPASFPTKTFAVPPQGAKDIYDLDAIDAQARARLGSPIAMLNAGGEKVPLRLVVQGAKHELWALWSGTKPNGDLAHKIRVLGVKNGIAYGLAGFTAKPTPSTGGDFGGHAVQLDRRVDRVDLRIPVFAPDSPRNRYVGDATVRGVTVIQVPDINAVWRALGVQDPIR